jgi:ABC-2 type transport system permease protein
MSTLSAGAALGDLPEITGGRGLSAAYSVEMRKLAAQTAVRLLALICLLAPFAYAVVLSIQAGTPADSIFGFWVHTSGFAISLTLLSFAGSYAFPLIAGIVAGDIFSSEDRHGTWKTILTRSCTREDIFVAKVLAAASVVVALSLLIAGASVIAGVVASGAHPLVNLSGQLTSTGRMLGLTLVAWLYCLVPVLAYVSLAILFSLATRNGILGVLGPIVVTLATQLLDLVGKGVTVHTLLIGGAFDGWHGLFTSAPFLGPLLIGIGVSLAWIAVTLALSWRILARRAFLATPGGSRGANWVTPLRTVAATIVVVALLALACSIGPTGVTADRVAASVGSAFNHLTLYQQALIGRQAPPNAHLDVQPQCNRRGTKAVGPGDWTCNLYVYQPQLKAIRYQLISIEYDVSVAYNGCWKAASPPALVGGQTMSDSRGRSVTNPLFTAYGCFNIL